MCDVFIDEWYWDEDNDQSEKLNECVELLKDKFFWLSWHKNPTIDWNDSSHKSLKEICETKFTAAQLNHSMRSSRKIIEAAKVVEGDEGDKVVLPGGHYPDGVPVKKIQWKTDPM